MTTDPLDRPALQRNIATTAKPSVLFVCVHDAGRSQMAAEWLAHLAGDRIEVRSAGSAPAGQVNPAAVAAMKEVGIDITDQTPKVLTIEAVEASDVCITMGCGDACPVSPGSATSTGNSRTPQGKASKPSAPSATRSRPVLRPSSPNCSP